MESTEGDTSLTPLILHASDAISASNATFLVLIILFLLVMSAIIASAETAYFSLTTKDINFLKTKTRGKAHIAASLLEQPKILLATMVVANNFINIAIVITTSYLIAHLFPTLTGTVAFVVNVVCVTFVLVLFGEVLPKVYANQNNLRVSVYSASFLQSLRVLFLPVSKVLVSSTKFIEQKLASKKGNNISNEDFEHAIELTVGHTATKEEVNIFKGILKFGNITARQVMRTRMDVSSINYEMTFDEVKKYCIEAGYSRLPVYKDNLDKISGVIHTKDFLPYFDRLGFNWHILIRQAYFVHESKLIDDLLKEFQHRRVHLAVVVDEFGGTSGIITLEDIMEEIIGDISDEFDVDDLEYKKIDDHNFIFEGKMLINDFCRVVGVQAELFETARGESDSLAGLLLELSGKFPALNEIINFRNFEFTVQALNKMRIEKIKVTIQPTGVPSKR